VDTQKKIEVPPASGQKEDIGKSGRKKREYFGTQRKRRPRGNGGHTNAKNTDKVWNR